MQQGFAMILMERIDEWFRRRRECENTTSAYACNQSLLHYGELEGRERHGDS